MGMNGTLAGWNPTQPVPVQNRRLHAIHTTRVRMFHLVARRATTSGLDLIDRALGLLARAQPATHLSQGLRLRRFPGRIGLVSQELSRPIQLQHP